MSNASAHRLDSGATTLAADGSSEASDSRSKTYTTVNLRAEFRF